MPLKIIDYTVVTSNCILSVTKEIVDMERSKNSPSPIMRTVKDFGIEEMVQIKIEKGYQPYGFLEIRGEYQYTTYTQAMVKYSKDTVV